MSRYKRVIDWQARLHRAQDMSSVHRIGELVPAVKNLIYARTGTAEQLNQQRVNELVAELKNLGCRVEIKGVK